MLRHIQYLREQQDEYAINSYKRAAAAWEAGKFNDEVAPITIPGKRGKPDTVVSVDEEYTNIKIDKIALCVPPSRRTAPSRQQMQVQSMTVQQHLLSAVKLAKEQGLTPLQGYPGLRRCGESPRRVHGGASMLFLALSRWQACPWAILIIMKSMKHSAS